MEIRNRSGFSASDDGISRRNLLRGAGLAAALIPLSGVLAACGSDSGGGGAAAPAAAKGVPLPTYVPPVKPKALLEGSAEGVMDVYASFPMDGPRTVNGTIGDGSDFNVLIMTYGQPSPPVDQSPYWQLLNKELNLNVIPHQVPYADFQTKFPALVAGDDLPEFVSVPLYENVARLPQLAEAQFTDLSEFLSGDAVKKYPNLAGIQKAGWLNGYLNGRIYGVPKSDPVFSTQIYTKTDVIQAAGANPQPANLQEFKDLAKAVTNAQAGVYAFGGNIADFMMMMFGVPNKWTRKADGSFVSAWEHEAFIPAMSELAELYKSGCFHPDTPTLMNNKVQRDALFRSGKLAMLYDGNRSVGIVADDKDVVFDIMVPFGKDGGNAVHWTGGGAYAMTMIKKTTDKKRIDMFLRVLDYIAAPFGSRESFIMSYGVEGVDYEVKDGVAVLTTRGQREQDLGLAYIAGGPQVLCDPQGAPGVDKLNHDWQQKVVPMLLDNPAAHLYSETFNSKGSALQQQMQDAVTAVFLGREPASGLTAAVQKWKTGGGDKMAKEYAEAATHAG
ncbi:extracellular solute-binding protein [Planotetraspora kaengkrachanensis]|uniref:Sugar ABC transporter substrate-binding protein n=1 Tax=Planotetraspora kaengkrachanensis TaxID=575193 RepID=A0A8J3PWM4_9ACTN|nr:extracellular solute-binding protein [Planotetraspora kaengkrachanensis]GIG82266.1 sugar ABC transporter substrate-binding protein [Planotetraspora kaengkrachanensis]